MLVPFFSRSMVFTMPEFLEKRFSPTARWVLSIISLFAYALTKVAVGIFAGGIVFATLLPELHLELGSMVLNSFWIGSILVIVLTGIYTILGGLRAVAYTEALQTVVLIFGSILVTVFGLLALGDGGLVDGWERLREICGSDMFNLWKPLVPEGVQSTWSPVMETNAAGDVVRQAWYFNGNYPWLGLLFCAPIIGLAWIPVIQGGRGLYYYLQSVQGYLAPPIFVVFFLGVTMKRLNSKGCLAALLIGFLLGVFRLAVDTPVKMKWFGVDAAGKAIGYEQGSLLWIVNNMYFQYYSLLIFLVCVVVMIGVSLLTKPPSMDRISGLTYGTVTAEHRLESRRSWNWVDVTASVVLGAAILWAYLYFNG